MLLTPSRQNWKELVKNLKSTRAEPRLKPTNKAIKYILDDLNKETNILISLCVKANAYRDGFADLWFFLHNDSVQIRENHKGFLYNGDYLQFTELG